MQPKTRHHAALAGLASIERTAEGERLRLDLREVECADSELMARIVILAGRCRARGTRLHLVGSASVLAWVELCRLEGLVEVAAA